MFYNPFPRTPTSAARVNVRDGRANNLRATTYINLPDPKAPRVRRVKKRRKFIKRITCK